MLELFTGSNFIDLVITSFQANGIAKRATQIMRRSSKLQYGVYRDGAWHWSDKQTPEHTHRQLAYASQELKPYREDEEKAHQY